VKFRLTRLIISLAVLVAVALPAPGTASATNRNPSAGIPLLTVGIPLDLSTLDAAKEEQAYIINQLTLETLLKLGPQGPYSVVATLNQPNAAWQFVPALFSTSIFEMKFAEAHPGTYGDSGSLIMGTGPWEVDSFDPTSGAELSANPGWWGGTVPVQHITFKFFSNETSLALAFRAGEIDLDPEVDNPRTFAATSGAKLLTTPSCAGAIFSMDTRVSPWNDIHVRARWPMRSTELTLLMRKAGIPPRANGPRPADFTGTACQSPDPSWYTFLLGSWNTAPGQFNIADYSPPAVDNLIKAAGAATDPAKRFADYSTLLQRLALDEPYVPILVSDFAVAISSKFDIPDFDYWTFYEDDWGLLLRPST
jgi:ABC-type transport system substrate-binding protein